MMNWKTFVVAMVVLFPGISTGQDCYVGGPYSVDANTLLLLHFDGTYVGAQGETPAAMSGTEFRPGKFSSGVFIDGLDFLRYAPVDNIALEQGTVEFWVQPDSPISSTQPRLLFEVSAEWDGDGYWADRLKLAHLGTDTFRFQTFNAGESGIIASGYPWTPGEWYHVGITWEGKDIALYVNGELRAQQTATYFPDTLNQVIKIGSGCDWGGFSCPEATAQPSKAVIDEFRISDTVRCFGQVAPPAETLSCAGFEPPMANYPVMVKKSRALPLKAEVFDADGFALTDVDLATPPVVQVWFDSGDGGDAVDVTDDVLSVGQGDEGNQFVFTEGDRWQFNLSTKNYTSPGAYTVLMQSGDDSEYVIEPTCMTEFVIK